MQQQACTAMQGLKVLELAHVIAGPFAGMQMALMGAQVTKIEAPAGGDYLKSLPHGQRAYAALNAMKEQRVLDLASAEGLQQAQLLAAEADVLIDSYAPGALARKGLDWASLQARNPRLIYCSISGFGSQDAAWGERRAYDHIIQAMTGLALLTGNEGDPPIKVGFPVVDTASGNRAVSAVLAALLERARTGRGQYLEVGMAQAALQLLFPHASEVLATGADTPRVGNVGYSGSPAARFFPCADGWLALGANTAAQTETAMRVLGLRLPAVHGNDSSRIAAASAPERAAAIGLALHDWPALEAETRLSQAGVPAARVRTLHEFLLDARQAGWLNGHSDTTGSPTRQLGLGWRSFGAAG
jgi:crotonobetainyl-CoA:carnitine CoA-transferase CaiB-like acyl-CoA transferase